MKSRNIKLDAVKTVFMSVFFCIQSVKTLPRFHLIQDEIIMFLFKQNRAKTEYKEHQAVNCLQTVSY